MADKTIFVEIDNAISFLYKENLQWFGELLPVTSPFVKTIKVLNKIKQYIVALNNKHDKEIDDLNFALQSMDVQVEHLKKLVADKLLMLASINKNQTVLDKVEEELMRSQS